MFRTFFLAIFVSIQFSCGVRINFTNCHHPDWSCLSNIPNDIVYTCPASRNTEFVIHLKDFYTDHVYSVTVQNCKNLQVVLDCPLLQRTSRLQKFVVKDCDKLEFTTLTSNSLSQTPPEVKIDNVKEIIAFPRNLFKSPTSNTELKCMGATQYKKIHVKNSKINSINTKAIYNVSGIKSVEFENVTITNLQSEGIEIITSNDNTLFAMTESRVDNLEPTSLKVQIGTSQILTSRFNDIKTNVINITADNVYLVGNTFKEISANGISVTSVNTDISDNIIYSLKTNALANIRCAKKRTSKRHMNFIRNRVENLEPYSLYFDHTSCKTAATPITYRENKFDCKCRNIAFLNSQSNSEQNSLVLNLSNNNTCIVSCCVLPVEVIKLLLESHMCHLNLDPQVMCLLYNDKNSVNEVTTDEDVTEPAPTFYLIRQANSLKGDTGAAMTAIDKDDLLKDSHLNMMNKTTVKVVFDSSRDFVETLRSTNRTRSRATENKSPPREEYVSHCVGTQCRNNAAYNKQRALDFYKYVYAQLRTPRQNDNQHKKT